MGVLRTLAVKGATLGAVLLAVLSVLVVSLGATGLSDRLLSAMLSEDLRALRQGLAQKVRDPEELERVVEAQRQELMKLYNLDKPWYFRLPSVVWRVLTLDLGSARVLKSFTGSATVSDIILERLPNTIILVTSAMAINAVLGLFIGVKLAMKAGSKLDRAASYLSAMSYATPTWWVGIILILILSFKFSVFPSGGMYSAPPPINGVGKFLDILWHAALPILTLVISNVGGWTYSVRTMVLNITQEDFVTVAKAKWLPERTIMRRYVIRVAAPPILTNIGLGLTGSLAGAVLTETGFNWPGMGRLYYDAVLALDETVIVALTFMFTLLYVVARFMLEVLYVALDPRVR
ncbi:MAG: ABC transporter permease [Candidatus Bathyarchaeia archaeon]